jgi:hypothetical protein
MFTLSRDTSVYMEFYELSIQRSIVCLAIYGFSEAYDDPGFF